MEKATNSIEGVGYYLIAMGTSERLRQAGAVIFLSIGHMFTCPADFMQIHTQRPLQFKLASPEFCLREDLSGELREAKECESGSNCENQRIQKNGETDNQISAILTRFSAISSSTSASSRPSRRE